MIAKHYSKIARIVLKQWDHRKLILLGKVTVIKTFALPNLIYPLTVLSNPPEYILREINSCIFDFIWNKKPDKIKRDILIQTISDGGINVPNIFFLVNSLKASWIKRYLDDKNTGVWKSFYRKALRPHGDELILECNLNDLDVQKTFPKNTFLQEIITSWNKIQKHQPNSKVQWKNTLL